MSTDTASSSSMNISPWGNLSTTPACSLNEVMSEELAIKLEKEQCLKYRAEKNDGNQFMTSDDLDVSNDMLLAQMLQHEFNKEYDREIQIKENQVNSDSKVKLSFKNYRVVHPSLQDDIEFSEEEIEETPDRKVEQRNFRGRGFSGKGRNIVTKHDAKIWGQKHTDRVIDQFPIEMNTGDAIGMDIKLSNKVYNNLKSHTKTEVKRSQRLHEKKEHATAEHAMDPKTRLILYKLINNGTLDDVDGIISTGKESVVFHAKGGGITTDDRQGQSRDVPEEVAIKVFKTTLTQFKNRADYMKGDVRFFKDEFKKQNTRKIMRLWADKEVFNLKLMTKYGIPCPKVIQLKKHVLVMGFIGKDNVASPKMKDAKLNALDAQISYEQCVQNMKTMYHSAHLVHGDLSEYNMLWHDQRVYFIDVSQAVDRLHPHAHEFLLRDCRNVAQFFIRLGVHNVPTEHELFNEITGLGLKGQGVEFLMNIQEYEKNEEKLRTESSNINYPFDFFFEHVKREKDGERVPDLHNVLSSDEEEEEVQAQHQGQKMIEEIVRVAEQQVELENCQHENNTDANIKNNDKTLADSSHVTHN